jgi:NADPH:quinone reductase-like Zn-dependent oxidoreductase
LHAAVLHALGDTPSFEEFAEPAPAKDEALVSVSAAALKPVDRQRSSGTHYASPRTFPVVCGIDGVGSLENGKRVFFAGPRPPYGSMAERCAVHEARCWPIPDGIDNVTVAAIVNPGMSAWLSLAWRAKLIAKESVLILGATGTTGKLAVQIARMLGAGRIIAVGRDEPTLRMLPSLGADLTIKLDDGFAEAIEKEASKGLNVILDYLWGTPTETVLATLARPNFAPASCGRMRLLQVGESAGATVSLPAAALRSSSLEIMGAGSGAMPSFEHIRETYDALLRSAAAGVLRVETEGVPLREVARVWNRPEQSRRRIVLLP